MLSETEGWELVQEVSLWQNGEQADWISVRGSCRRSDTVGKEFSEERIKTCHTEIGSMFHAQQQREKDIKPGVGGDHTRGYAENGVFGRRDGDGT